VNLRNYRNLFLFVFLNCFGLERAIFFIYFTESGHSAAQVSTLQVALFLTVFAAELPTGVFADVYGRKTSLIVGVLLKAASLVLQTTFVESFPALFASFLLYAVSFSFISGSLEALLWESADRHGDSARFAKLAAAVELLGSVALAGAMALGPWVKSGLGWSWVYYCTAAANVLAAVAILPVADATRVEVSAKPRFDLGTHIVGARKIIPLALPVALTSACFTPFFINSQLLLEEASSDLPWIGLGIAVVELTSSLYLFVFMKKPIPFRRRTLLPIVGMFALLCAANVAGRALLSLSLMFVMSILIGYLAISLQDAVNRRVDDSIRAAALSFVSFLDTICISSGYALFGIVSQHQPIRVAIASLAVFPLLSVVVLAIVLRKQPRNGAR
jgi:MFS family permease